MANKVSTSPLAELFRSEGLIGPTTEVISHLSSPDLLNCASVGRAFGKRAMEEFCYRVETEGQVPLQPKTEEEVQQIKARLLALGDAGLIVHFRGQNRIFYQRLVRRLVADSKMDAFVPTLSILAALPVFGRLFAAPELRFSELARTIENNFLQHVGSRADLLALRTGVREVRSVEYLRLLSNRVHAAWQSRIVVKAGMNVAQYDQMLLMRIQEAIQLQPNGDPQLAEVEDPQVQE